MRLKQTFAVVPVEERHVDDRGLLLLPLEHVAVLRPVAVLQDGAVDLGERLLQLCCVVSRESQSLITKQRLDTVSDEPPHELRVGSRSHLRARSCFPFFSFTLKLCNKTHLKRGFEVLINGFLSLTDSLKIVNKLSLRTKTIH